MTTIIPLSFADTVIHDNGVIELIPHQDVEVTGKNISEFTPLPGKYDNNKILVNRKNHYSHTFEAIQAIRQLDSNLRIAIVAPTDASKRASLAAHGEKPTAYTYKIFNDHKQAMDWLLNE